MPSLGQTEGELGLLEHPSRYPCPQPGSRTLGGQSLPKGKLMRFTWMLAGTLDRRTARPVRGVFRRSGLPGGVWRLPRTEQEPGGVLSVWVPCSFLQTPPSRGQGTGQERGCSPGRPLQTSQPHSSGLPGTGTGHSPKASREEASSLMTVLSTTDHSPRHPPASSSTSPSNNHILTSIQDLTTAITLALPPRRKGRTILHPLVTWDFSWGFV